MLYHVFSHFPCNDGELAKVIWSYFKNGSAFYKWNHSDNYKEIEIINNLPQESNVVFLDVTPPIEKLSNKHHYIIIDHHLDPILQFKNKNLENYNYLLFTHPNFPEENNMSGCILTWKYFSEAALPSVVHHVGNKDVWNFSDPDTEAYCVGYNIYLNSDYYREGFILKLLQSNELDEQIISIGRLNIENYKTQAFYLFEYVEYNNIEYNDFNYKVIDIKCSDSYLYKYLIEYAEENYKDFHVLRILNSEKNNIKTYSLRSIGKDITVDGIARLYGGNGHPRAAGYSILI